jgi:hypothetical protein
MNNLYGRTLISDLTKFGARTSDHVTLGKVIGKVQRSRDGCAAFAPRSAHVYSTSIVSCRDAWTYDRDELISTIEEVCFRIDVVASFD